MTGVILLTTAVAIGVIILLGYLRSPDKPNRYFGEGKLGTWLSFALLVASACVCFVLRRRQRARGVAPLARFWLLLGVLLAYLAVDEVLELHEHLDRMINSALGWHPLDRVGDRIDDAIVAAYALVALAVAWVHRRELLRLRWTVLMFALAFACFAAMVALDTLRKLDTLEDSLKLLAEALILCGLLAGDPDGASARPS